MSFYIRKPIDFLEMYMSMHILSSEYVGANPELNVASYLSNFNTSYVIYKGIGIWSVHAKEVQMIKFAHLLRSHQPNWSCGLRLKVLFFFPRT